MWRTPDGHVDLFYSASRWDTGSYAIGWASCAGPAGPCRQAATVPLMASHGTIAGPGGPQVFTDVAGQAYLAFHAWTVPTIGYPQGARSLHIDPLSFANGSPVISG
jgi:hypothetical protein